MPVVHRFRNVRIIIWADDHPPPHFHVRSPDTDCKVDLDTFQVIAGRFTRVDLAEALAWAAENLGALRREWRKHHERD